ncbi:hypothetical protein [Indioceanicola profundi]|uniref:hypothetical protein n=1 Tax=Indioceanicola profundi TaxID=2220096 RepID=UPI000E6AA0FC|nr:hypothetical protein [Indioceanicola profundi]
MRPQAIVAILAIAAAGVGGGVLLERQLLSADAASPATSQDRKILYWWEPMIPDYKSDNLGKSPMGMDMVPVYEGEEPGASWPPLGFPTGRWRRSESHPTTLPATAPSRIVQDW